MALMAAGTGLQLLGQYGANLQQAMAEAANAAYYRKQSAYARESAQRAERLAGFEYAYKIGQQISGLAGSGVDVGDGSAAVTVGSTIANALSEIQAIKRKGDLDVELAAMRGDASDRNANLLNSPSYNLLQAGTSLMKNYAGSEGFGTMNDNRTGIQDKYPGFGSGVGNNSSKSYGSGDAGLSSSSYQSKYLGTVGG